MRPDISSAPLVDSHILAKKSIVGDPDATNSGAVQSKKRKIGLSKSEKARAFSGYGNESRIGNGNASEERDENRIVSSTKKKSPTTSNSNGNVPLAKKLKSSSSSTSSSSSSSTPPPLVESTLMKWISKTPLAERPIQSAQGKKPSWPQSPDQVQLDALDNTRTELDKEKMIENNGNKSKGTTASIAQLFPKAHIEPQKGGRIAGYLKAKEPQEPSPAKEEAAPDEFDSLWRSGPKEVIIAPQKESKSETPTHPTTSRRRKKATAEASKDDFTAKTPLKHASLQQKAEGTRTAFDEEPAKASSTISVRDFFSVRPKANIPTASDVTIEQAPKSANDVSASRVNQDDSDMNKKDTESLIGADEKHLVEENMVEIPMDSAQELDPSPDLEDNLIETRRPRRRLVRGRDRPVRYIETSESEQGEEEEARPKEVTKAKSEIESEPDSEPEIERVRSPSPDTKKSQLFMKSFFSSARSVSSQSTPGSTPGSSNDSSIPAPNAETTSKAFESAERPVTKITYGSRKTKPVQKKARKKSNFSDSDAPLSDSGNVSDDWDDDFMKLDSKPDPNQKAITSMFSISARPSFPSKPQPKRTLSARSRILLSGGLSNVSNTCYLNSVLQSLRNTVECRDTFFKMQEKMRAIEEKSGSPLNITDYQRALFEGSLAVMAELDNRERTENELEVPKKAIYPKDVVSTLHGGDSLFNTHSQQDAAEFMFYVISQFDDVLREILVAGQKETLPVEDRIPKDWQPINDLFQVGTQSVTHCLKCPAVTVMEDRGIDLTVQIDNENPTMVRDLDWGISETMKKEHMKDDNRRFCERCTTKEDAHVYHYFTSLPKILILRLQRYNFKEGAIKLQNSVACTEELHFGKWMSEKYGGPDPHYELCAVIIHRGRVITSGHYYVYIRKPTVIETIITEPDGESRTEQKTFQWLKYNDASVDPTSDEEMARVFSGHVGTSTLGEATLPLGGENATSSSSQPGSETGTGSPYPSINHDVDAATPYVYVYRRKESVT